MHKAVFLCAISNVSSGVCKEDCAFCTQSSSHKASIERFYRKETTQVLKEAHIAKSRGALGFCLVTSGKSLDDEKLEYLTSLASMIRREIPSLFLIACAGIADVKALKELKNAGFKSYNHNLETSERYYKNIASTIRWEERYATCVNVIESGLYLCSGGIFGIGEDEGERESFLESLASLNPMSVPINFFIPNDALKLQGETISKEKGIELVKKARAKLPQAMLMAAGGRELVFDDDLESLFESGANAIVIGDYLTTKGAKVEEDITAIKNLGYRIEENCPW